MAKVFLTILEYRAIISNIYLFIHILFIYFIFALDYLYTLIGPVEYTDFEVIKVFILNIFSDEN